MRKVLMAATVLASVLALSACGRDDDGESETSAAPKMVMVEEAEAPKPPPPKVTPHATVAPAATAASQIDEDAAATGMTARSGAVRSNSTTTLPAAPQSSGSETP
jgi:hypothetical protein